MKIGTIVGFCFAILHKLTANDFCCCFIEDDKVLKVFNTFTFEDQLPTNLLLIKKCVCKNLFTIHDLHKTNAVKCKCLNIFVNIVS